MTLCGTNCSHRSLRRILPMHRYELTKLPLLTEDQLPVLYPLWKYYFEDRFKYRNSTTDQLIELSQTSLKKGDIKTFNSAFVLSIEVPREEICMLWVTLWLTTIASLSILSQHSQTCCTYEGWGSALALRSKTCHVDLSPLMLKEATKKFYQAFVHHEDKLSQLKPPQTSVQTPQAQSSEVEDNESDAPVSEEMAQYELIMEYLREWKKKENGRIGFYSN